MVEPQTFTLEATHPTSRRKAILEDDGVSCWLYLTAPCDEQPVRDAFVYSRVTPTEDLVRPPDDGPPRLIRSVASPDAVLTEPDAAQFSLEWSAAGDTAAVLLRGRPIAMATVDTRFGFSRALDCESPFGQPWSDDEYRRRFPD